MARQFYNNCETNVHKYPIVHFHSLYNTVIHWRITEKKFE